MEGRRAVMFLILLVAFSLQETSTQASELIQKLRSDGIEEREEATRKLRELGKSALPALEKAAKESDKEVASRAQWLVRAIDLDARLTPTLKKVMPGLADRLASGDDHTWTQAFFEAVDKMKSPPGQPAVTPEDLDVLAERAVRGASSPAEKNDICAQVVLWRCRAAIPALLLWLKDESPQVRGDAASILSALQAREHVKDIVALLKDNDVGVRCNACYALARLAARESTHEILPLLKDPDQGVRSSAARALGEIGAQGVARELLPLLDDKSIAVRREAAEALGTLGIKEAAAPLQKMLNDMYAEVRASAVTALQRLGATDSLAGIANALKDDDPGVRERAQKAFVELAGAGGPTELVRLLKSEDGFVRRAAADVLGRSGRSEAVRDLIPLLKDDDEEVSESAAIALCRLGSREGVPYVIERSRSESLFVLNGVRGRDRWMSLHAKPLSWFMKGSKDAILQRLAKESGLELEIAAPATPEEEAWTGKREWIRPDEGIGTLRQALEDVLADGPYTAVLDADKIRVLPRTAALEFWKRWWAEEQSGDK